MSLKDELDAYVQKSLDEQWERRAGQKVPDADDLPLKKFAVELDATVLYADLASSTKLVKGHKDWFAAGVLQELSLLCSEDHSSAERYRHGL